MSKPIKIGVLTSGGDAPGMNAAVRAVVRTGLNLNMQVFGIRHGFEGLLKADIYEMDARRVADIIQRGGTLLRTARCPVMMTEEGQQKAAEIIRLLKFDALITIGGDGTFRGALSLSQLGTNVFGIPATIDLDMACTEYTIGFDTAVNTGIEAMNRIRDTSFSHERCSVIEVMGRNAGYLALWCGLTGGAEEVMIPEQPEINSDAVIQRIVNSRARGKRHNLIVVAEGVGGSAALAKKIQDTLGIETRALILGHLQRGGSPSALDRMHASVMGYMAVQAVNDGVKNKAVIYREGRHLLLDLEEAVNYKKTYVPDMHGMINVLAI